MKAAWPHGITVDEYFVPTAAGIEIFMASRRASEGPAVLLLHGLGVGWRYWDLAAPGYSTMDFLARKRLQVFALDHRGYGRSSPVDGWSVRAERAVDDVRAAIDRIRQETGLDRVHLVGHSWGGMVALMTAARFGSAVASLAVVGTPYLTLHESFRREIDEFDLSQAPADGWVRNETHLAMEGFLYSYDAGVIDEYKAVVSTHYPRLPLGIILDVRELPHAPSVREIDCPTLVVCGTLDDVVERADALRMLDDLASARKDLLLLGNTAHLPGLERLAHRRVDLALAAWVEDTTPPE